MGGVRVVLGIRLEMGVLGLFLLGWSPYVSLWLPLCDPPSPKATARFTRSEMGDIAP